MVNFNQVTLSQSFERVVYDLFSLCRYTDITTKQQKNDRLQRTHKRTDLSWKRSGL